MGGGEGGGELVWSEVEGIGRKLSITIMMDNGEIYGLQNTSIIAFFRHIQNIANRPTQRLEYLNILSYLYIILLQIVFLFFSTIFLI
jgi:hypothetical protein